MGRENVPAASRVDVLLYSRAASYTATSNSGLVLGTIRPPIGGAGAERRLAGANTGLLRRLGSADQTLPANPRKFGTTDERR